MAFSLIANSINGSTNSTNIPGTPLDTTGAGLIVIGTGVFSAYAPTPSDSFGNVYLPLTIHTSVLGGFVRLWYCLAPTVGPGHVFSLPGYSVCYPTMEVSAWACDPGTTLDQQNGAQAGGGTASTAQPGSILPVADNELLVTVVVGGDADGPTAIDSGFTLLDILAGNPLFSLSFGAAYLIQGTLASANPEWSGTDLQASAIASFREPGGPPPPPPPTPSTLPPGLTLNPLTGEISGVPTQAGTFEYTVEVTDADGNTAHVTCSIAISLAQGRHTLRWQILSGERPGRWFAHEYADPVLAHYLVEASASKPNDQELYLLGPGVLIAGGDTDKDAPINSLIVVPCNDLGDERTQKLFPDAMVQAGGTGALSIIPAFNNLNTYAPPTLANPVGVVDQFLVNIASLSDLALYRNIGVALSWTGGPSGPKVLAWEPAAYLQPYLSEFLVTQFINLSYPGWKSHRRLYPALISNSPVIFTIKCQDGRTFTYVIPSTGGQFRVIPMITNHGVKDLSFAYQLDGQGAKFALFPEAFTIETKGWADPEFLDLAIYKT